MRKLTILTAALLLLGLCGCSEAADSGAAATAKSTSATTETTAASTAVLGTDLSAEAESTDLTEESEAMTVTDGKPAMTLIGHASVKIKTSDGTVIYIDPAYSGDYSETADIILVTHGHGDHNKTSLCASDDETRVITYKEVLSDGVYGSFDECGVRIEAVPAENSNHPRNSSVGYILTFDGIGVYHAGDTSHIDEMKALSDRELDYALLPIDGVYNMDAAEAMTCAAEIGAKNNIPIHIRGIGDKYDADKAAAFAPDGVLHIAYGETVTLSDG